MTSGRGSAVRRALRGMAAGALAIGRGAARIPGVAWVDRRLQRIDGDCVGVRCSGAMSAVLARPRRALAAVLLVLVACGVAVSQLDAGAPPSLLANDGAPAAQATDTLETDFGGEPIVVLVKGTIQDTLTSQNLNALATLEMRLAQLKGTRIVFGPATFVGQTINQITSVVTREFGPAATRADAAAKTAEEQARRQGLPRAEQTRRRDAARLQALGPFRARYEEVLLRYGYVGVPSFENEGFLKALVLGARSTPKERFSWIFADKDHAIIAVRPRQGLGDDEIQRLGAQIERLAGQTKLQRLQLSVGGAPLVVSGLTDELSKELPRIAPVALLAMAFVLLLGLGVRWRSLATLLPAALAVLLTAALGWVLGLGLTPATIAALPVVLGLTIDYAVQLQARYRTRRAAGDEPAQAARSASAAVGPVLLVAGGVMVLGFLTLTVSSVPLVDRLGETMALGVLCGLVVALLFTGPLLVFRDRARVAPPQLKLPVGALAPRVRKALLVLAVVLPIAGLALSSQSEVESDVQKLAPRGMPEIKDIKVLQEELGSAGQLRISVRADDVTDPAVLAWMNRLQSRALAQEPRLTPGPNLAGILAAGSGIGDLTRADVQRLLRLVPPYFVSAALNRQRTQAEVSFGMPLLPAQEQGDIIERLQPLLDSAPPGTTAQAGGLVALSASSVTELEKGRPWLLLGAALVIFLLLLLIRRRLDRALVPLVPALLTAGTSSLFVVVAGLRLSPLSAGLEPLVLAVGVEFGLLLEARYHEERLAGRSEAEAARIAARMVGAPVAIAALTVAAGFAVLGASRLGVLQQFGLLAAGELVFCAAVAIVLVPFLAAAWERRRGGEPRRSDSVPPHREVAAAGSRA